MPFVREHVNEVPLEEALEAVILKDMEKEEDSDSSTIVGVAAAEPEVGLPGPGGRPSCTLWRTSLLRRLFMLQGRIILLQSALSPTMRRS